MSLQVNAILFGLFACNSARQRASGGKCAQRIRDLRIKTAEHEDGTILARCGKFAAQVSHLIRVLVDFAPDIRVTSSFVR